MFCLSWNWIRKSNIYFHINRIVAVQNFPQIQKLCWQGMQLQIGTNFSPRFLSCSLLIPHGFYQFRSYDGTARLTALEDHAHYTPYTNGIVAKHTDKIIQVGMQVNYWWEIYFEGFSTPPSPMSPKDITAPITHYLIQSEEFLITSPPHTSFHNVYNFRCAFHKIWGLLHRVVSIHRFQSLQLQALITPLNFGIFGFESTITKI